jgi:hypothetical protein
MSDTWPRWLHVLPSFSFICRHLFTSHPVAAWVAQLGVSHPGCEVTLLTPNMSFMALDPSITFVLLQGSTSLASRLPPPWVQHCIIIGSWDNGNQEGHPHWPTFTLPHSIYGGVISGNWVFSSTRRLQSPALPPVTVRALRHIIDEAYPVPSFQICAPPESLEVDSGEESPRIRWMDSDNVVLDWNGLLPVGQEQASLIRCPLVYSPTRWSTR